MMSVTPTQNTNENSIDNLLPMDEEESTKKVESDENDDTYNNDELEEDPAKVSTKHTATTSPWMRLGFIAVPFALGFGTIFFVFNSMMNGGSRNTALKPEATPTPTATPLEDKDGDLYAKLALAKQQEELDALNKVNQKQQEQPSLPVATEEKLKIKQQAQINTSTAKTVQSKSASPPPQRIVYRQTLPPQQQRAVVTVPPASTRYIAQSVPSRRAIATMPMQQKPSLVRSLQQQIVASSSPAKDPLAEIERLRTLGSIGRLEYASTSNVSRNSSNNLVTYAANSEATTEINTNSISPTKSRRRTKSTNNTSTKATNTPNQIEELRPRWETPQTINKEETVASKPLPQEAQQVIYNYLPEEAQILQEKGPQYLVVGSFAKATLITPIVSQNTSNNQQVNTTKFVARLDEPLMSHTGDVAIKAGTLVSITVLGVENSSVVRAEVTAIMKDQTEYPVSSGAIAILGKNGNPLIANKYHNKGSAIARYDTTLGVIAGLAKVGEIISEPNEEVIEDLPLGGTRTRRSRNGHRSLSGAFIKGAFGSVSEVISERTKKATNEIMNSPNVWYVPKNTEITIKVDRSLKL
ncbi:MAG: hypothetical protein KME30_25270 [Iphinoe sp. HA4291-MV1]|jgi:hypothetical protein|nr:hypothetical protein [Iphinoe sp. HA4291-MV1]